LFTSSTALGQVPRRYKIAVIDIHGNSEPDSTDIAYFVEKGVRTSTLPVSLVATDRVLNTGRQQNDEQNLAFGMDSLKAARTHFEAAKYERAAEHALQASVYFEQSHAFLPSTETYLEALLLQALALARTGSRENAVRILTRAYVVKPKLDDSAFSQETELFQEAKAAALNRDIGSITVVTQPGSSRVFVDGRYRGVAPTYRPGLRKGLHFVRVERQGFARAGVKIDAQAEQDVKVEVSLNRAAKHGALTDLLAGIQTELGREDLPATGSTMRLKSLLLTDYVILMDSSGPSESRRVNLTLYNLNTGRRIKVVSEKVNWSRRDRQAKNAVLVMAQKLLSPITTRAVSISEPEPALEAGEDGVVTKWWFWTAIGVAVAGVAIGLAVGLQPEETSSGIPKNGTGGLLLEF
jgi:hypothetical protein